MAPTKIPVFELDCHIARTDYLVKETIEQMRRAAAWPEGYQLMSKKVVEDALELQKNLSEFLALCEQAKDQAVPEEVREVPA